MKILKRNGSFKPDDKMSDLIHESVLRQCRKDGQTGTSMPIQYTKAAQAIKSKTTMRATVSFK